MLLKLLATYLKPHRGLIAGVIFFQLLQSGASLWLPTLNGYIITHGAFMLLVTIGQIICSITAVWFGARVAMGLGRDLRGAVFTHVGEFSEREVSRFGAPSLITGTTNHGQQVQ